MVSFNSLTFLCLILPVLVASIVRYDGYRLVQLTPNSAKQLELINDWQKDPNFDVWHQANGLTKNVEVVLSPKNYKRYKNLFDMNKIKNKILNGNIQRKIDEESRSMLKPRSELDIKKSVVAKYASYNEISKYLDTVASENSEYIKVYSAGTTNENRDLKVLWFKTKSTQRSIWISCGIHAREWVSISTCTYMIDRLIDRYNSNDAEIVDLLNYYEIHIIPLLNPDGYEYSKIERLWRKNRVKNQNSECIGVDLNRNFPFKWMENNGASSDPCSIAYAGPSPKSELEIQAVERIIKSKLGNWDSFIDMHSYGQFYLIPYGYTNELPKEYPDLLRAAKVSADAIYSFNKTLFAVGNSYELLYVSSGTSDDWAFGECGIKYSYTLELQPSFANGFTSSGFIFPEDNAPGVGEEMYRGLVALFAEIKKANNGGL